jgi:hypothetical protein
MKMDTKTCQVDMDAIRKIVSEMTATQAIAIYEAIGLVSDEACAESVQCRSVESKSGGLVQH